MQLPEPADAAATNASHPHCHAAGPLRGAGVSPESAEVKALVGRGLDYLQRNPVGDPAIGGKALTALAFVKSNRSDHPLVKSTIKLIHGSEIDWPKTDNYSLGLSIILLSELNDQDRNMVVMQKLVDELLKRQKDHGGWGYGAPYGPRPCQLGTFHKPNTPCSPCGAPGYTKRRFLRKRSKKCATGSCGCRIPRVSGAIRGRIRATMSASVNLE